MQLLALDIGNTAVTYGIFQKDRLRSHGSVLHSNIPKIIRKWSKSGVINKQSSIIVSSVVPQLTLTIKKHLSGFKGGFWVINENLQVPILHRYRTLKKLGSDRILNVYGSLEMYRSPLLILDFGTALTADYVSGKGVFEGGMIIPGPEIAFQALLSRTALLPKNARLPEKSVSFLGRTTYDCMKSGILEGYGAMVDGLVNRFRARYGKSLKVLATGGFACHLKGYARSFDILDPLHSLKSLHLIYQNVITRRRPR